MPAIHYWFSGSALAAVIAFATAVSATGYAWYRAAVSEQDSEVQNADAAAQKQKSICAKDLLGKALVDGKEIQAENDLTDDKLQRKVEEWATHTQELISAARRLMEMAKKRCS
jgi:hypothetical protein